MTMNSDPTAFALRRSVLSLPASNERAIAKLGSLAMDAVILDLEDAVAEEMKAAARDNIRKFMAAGLAGGREIIIRINDAASPHYQDDLALVLETQPNAVLLPKVRTSDDVLDLSLFLSENDAPDMLRIWAMMETPLAILNAGSIAETGRTRGGRLDCLVVGLNDLRKDTGVMPDPARTYLVPWLMQVVLAGRGFGLSVIDSVSNDFRDLAPFEAECAQGRAMGFDGKMLIHPAQIDAANRHFQPSESEIADARAIIDAFSAAGAASLNALSVGGRMVERLHFQQALALIAKVDIIRARSA
ncbi:CoA ester lyase [Rhizobium sp. KVB221]|uniref:CoA ester lyase n=1 Tax=Rhizobium setariae TaxID=2801340 RepID=A0A936YSN7_9HYPH|nr:CoA ester lyase [Rhizobium setariae]MBL0374051.1 CoA ester lyase [Rhizobium setariae]